MASVFLYVPVPSALVARQISYQLLKRKLVACTNFFPMQSMYRWKGKLQQEKEYVLLLKTEQHKVLAVRREVIKLHPYDVACIATIPVQLNLAYQRWLREQIRLP